jgi:hypothetical protein
MTVCQLGQLVNMTNLPTEMKRRSKNETIRDSKTQEYLVAVREPIDP